ncbi:UDP-N-acetylmuramate dehydrogenase [Snodgrassella sp. R-53583]|nr:UDP-N-acetylmuramate dehydrogenase [Snodgrassella sp. R-53583]
MMMDVIEHADLQPLNTFALPVRARWLVTLNDAAQLPDIMALPQFDRQSVLWLGGGSNILFCADYPALVVRVANRGIRLIADDGERVLVEAAAGENWHEFVQYTLAQGWNGLENLSLIPGTVGAAPVQNIGAYGVEVQSCIEAVQCFDLEARQLRWLSCADCCFAYRDSIFKHGEPGRYVIVAVRFGLSRCFTPQLHYGDLAQVVTEQAQGQTLTASMVAQAVCRIRQQKLPDPRVLGSAGSFFKNPVVPAALATSLLDCYPALPHYPQPDGRVKLAAGWLIDQCGLKGYQLGGAAVHERQALVLVNRGQASAADVVALAKHVQDCVAQRFQVQLEPEPVWLP